MVDESRIIVEGCLPDTPHQLMYLTLPVTIPKNVKTILSDHHLHPHRYLLYGERDAFGDLEILDERVFDQDPTKEMKGGWPILSAYENFRWCFDAQRSIATPDGRLYVDAHYFQRNWRWYLDVAQTILDETRAIFTGETDEEYFHEHPSRAY